MKRNLVMTVFVAALAVYTFFEYRKSMNEGTFAEDERAPFSLQSHEVDYLKIDRPQDPVELRKREDGKWMMIKPVEDEVEEASALSVLLALTTQRVRLFNAEGEKAAAADWAKYGLEPPGTTFTLGAGKKQESLSISTKNAFDGSFYLRQGNELLVGDTGFAQVSARASNSFRSRELFRDVKVIEKAEVMLESEKYALVKTDGKWSLAPEPSFPVDASKIEAWIERVRSFRPLEIVKDDVGEEDRRAFLLVVPSLVIQIGDWRLTAGQDRAQDVFLQTNRKSTVFKSSAQALAQIRVPSAFFRDGKKPLTFAIEKARRIEIRDGKTEVVFNKSDKGWSNGKDEPADTEAIALMQAIGALEAREFPAAKKTGIASPQVLVKDESGKELLSLAWGDEYPAREAYNNGVTLRYARTNLDKDVFGLAKDKVMALLNAAKKAEPK